MEWIVSAAYTGYRSLMCGMVAYFPTTTPPAGWLRANQTAVSATAYAGLASVLYCGDSLNATAPMGYRCTNPANPSGSRSITGGFIVLPEARGEFLRGLDDSRSVDEGRVVGSSQAATSMHWSPNSTITGAAASIGATDVDSSSPGGSPAVTYTTGGGTPASKFTVRPRNIALLGCIKF